ncbi:MAG: chromosomal replication initiator protein DnaA [Mycoplasmoidaceae bacterium]
MQNKEFLKKVWVNIQIKMQNFIENQNFYENFFLKTNITKIENNHVVIEAPNEFSKKIIEEEFADKIYELFLELTNQNMIIKYSYKGEVKKQDENKIEKIKEVKDNLNYKLTFDNFIVGKFNKKLLKAAKQICDDEQNKYNPFFVYGNTGLGKTHIINAIGIELKKERDLIVKYMNIEDFVRESYEYMSYGGKEIEEYKKSFDSYDVLIVDDIQFLSNKDKMNEIFFNIFNYYIKNNKKIIISSDRNPNELKIDNRMISRFNSGLTIKLDKPDLDTICEIIKHKIDKDINGIKFSNNSIKFIANRFNSDIRSLEGVINKIIFQVSIEEEENFTINEEKIKELLDIELDNGLVNSGYKVSPNIIIETVAMTYSVSKELIVSKIRTKEVAFARQICIYVLREKMNMSYAEIGTFFSNRDHSTILEAYKKIKKMIETDSDLNKFINNLINNI